MRLKKVQTSFMAVICLLTWVLNPLNQCAFGIELVGSPEDVQRFEQILKGIGDRQDQFISDQEFVGFLMKHKEFFKKDLEKQNLLFLVEDKIDIFIINQQLTVFTQADGDRNAKIGIHELRGFESAKFDSLIKKGMADLLKEAIELDARPIKEKQKDILTEISKRIHVRKSYLDKDDIATPANLSFTNFGRNDESREAGTQSTALEVQGAIFLTPEITKFDWSGQDYIFKWEPSLVYEADVSSDDSKKKDKVTHRIGFEGILGHRDLAERTWNHYFTLSFDYITDSDYQADSYGGTFQYIPDIHGYGIRESLSSKDGNFAFLWKPYLGINGASVTDPGDSGNNLKSYYNFFARAAFEFTLWKKLKITPEFAFYQELKNDKDGHVLFTTTVRYVFDPNERIAFQFVYERGEVEPKFTDKDIAKVSLGIKF